MKHLLIAVLTLFLSAPVVSQEGEYAEVNGVKIYYEIHGEGEPLLLLHGLTGSHAVWNSWMDDFSDEFKIIIPDLRGHGQSTNPTKEFNHKLTAQDMFALMDKLNIQRFGAMGHSTGGMTITHMITMDTTRIDNAVIIGATTHFPESAKKIMRSIKPDVISSDWMNFLKSQHPRGEEQIEMLLSHFGSLADKSEMHFSNEDLAKIKARTLIIHGDRDEFFPVDIPVNSYQVIPDSQLWIIPNYGHELPNMNTQLGELFVETIINFLRDQ